MGTYDFGLRKRRMPQTAQHLALGRRLQVAGIVFETARFQFEEKARIHHVVQLAPEIVQDRIR